MTLEELIRAIGKSNWTLEVYGVGSGYLKVWVRPSDGTEFAHKYWLVGNVLLEEPPESPLPPEENEEGVWVDVTARAAEFRAIVVEAVAA
jgi:hypothetical protein